MVNKIFAFRVSEYFLPMQVSEMVLYCDAEWEIDRENLNLLEVIGEGAFGKVLKAEAFGLNRQNMGKTIVAVKTLKGDCLILS
jgi:hypothetical protein